MPEYKKPVLIELGIELLVELLLFLLPYGAEQMDLPHSFWLGLLCWLCAVAIAVRMFWIFPLWVPHRTELEKGLIVFVGVGLFCAIFYSPVVTAYKKRNDATMPQHSEEHPAENKPDPAGEQEPPTIKPIPHPKRPREEAPVSRAKSIDVPSISQQSHGNNSPNVATFGNNSPATVTVNPEKSPYAPLQTYDFGGARRTSEPGRQSVIAGEETVAFQKLAQLYNTKDWEGLHEASEEQIKKTPEWLTPYLFSGVASMNLGDKERAKHRLTYVKTKASGNSQYADAERLLELLNNKPMN
jgi:hypothetical protein